MRKLFLLLLLCASVCYSYAQDANYWSNSYNPGNFFVPGAVLTYNRDSGVFFYNPALLAYETKNSASFNGNLYQYRSDKIRNGAGNGLDLNSSNASIVPLLVSGTIALKTKKPFAISYGLIRNPIENFQSTQRKDTKMNVLDDSYSPGNEVYVGQIASQNKITQTSAFANVGFKISSRWALGFSIEGQIYQQDLSESYSSNALLNAPTSSGLPPIASSKVDYQANLTHAGLKFKAGLAFNSGKHHLGLLVSSPIVHVGGSATLYSDLSINNIIFTTPTLDTFSLLANTRQTKLKPSVKAPFSFAVGYSYDYNQYGQIYLAAEYFTKVNQYNVITPKNDYFIKSDTVAGQQPTSELINLVNANKAVLNFGLGISYKIADNILGYTSFTSDFSFNDKSLQDKEDAVITSTTSHWNLWHLQFGANFKRRKFNLRPGLLLSYGRTNNYIQPINFDSPNEANLLLGDAHPTPARHFSAGLMFSYIYNL
ncbi:MULTISPECIES: hypothetical protein [Chitinophagaceae]